MTPTRRCARATTNRGTDDRPIDSRVFASRRENNLREASLDGGVREEVFACVRRARARATRAHARRDDGCDSRGDAGAVCAVFVVLIFFFVFVSSGRDARGWEFSRLRGTKETRD